MLPAVQFLQKSVQRHLDDVSKLYVLLAGVGGRGGGSHRQLVPCREGAAPHVVRLGDGTLGGAPSLPEELGAPGPPGGTRGGVAGAGARLPVKRVPVRSAEPGGRAVRGQKPPSCHRAVHLWSL